MKWFKHISDSLDDPFIFDLCRECGPTGYYVFFGVLEIYSREFKTENEFRLVVSWSYLCSKLAATRSQHIKKALLYCNKKGRFNVYMNGNQIEIFIPKFRKYLDEFTLKKLRAYEQKSGVNPESIRSQSGHTPEKIPPDEDEDKDINSTPPTPPKGETPVYSNSFQNWWDKYPKKVGKDAAYKAWKKIGKESRAKASELLSALEAQVSADHFKNGKGESFIPNPVTWLNQGRWQDEIKTKAPDTCSYQQFKAGDNRYAD